MSGAEVAILFVLSCILAIVPIVIALVRKTANRWAVVIVAILTSWTFIGWIIAIVMAAAGKKTAAAA